MNLFPAIDLLGGQAVRLTQGDYSRQSSYGDPLGIARGYALAGATHVHVVDLSAARSGRPDPEVQAIVRQIVAETDLLVQLGGGIRSREAVAEWLDIGVWRCVLGTAAIRDYHFAETMVGEFGEAVVIGIDAREGLVATAGWETTERLTAVEVASAMKAFGFGECIHTDIGRDGMLAGANVEASAQLAQVSGLRVIVSGGVRDEEDIRRVVGSQARGLVGVIAGKSLLEGTLDLTRALAIVGVGARVEAESLPQEGGQHE